MDIRKEYEDAVRRSGEPLSAILEENYHRSVFVQKINLTAALNS